jgi:hypothetical protein
MHEWTDLLDDEDRPPWYWGGECRWVALLVDKPWLSGCYGVVLRIGKLRLSAPWPVSAR